MSPQIAYWEPEDRIFWGREGESVARRNLCIAVPALVLSFAVWMVWSVVVVQLPHVGFRFTSNQLFWLVALPGLAGGTLRLFFSFMVPMFGGRTWTVVSTLALLLPTVGLGLAVQDPSTSYPSFLVLAILAGIGGGNFASSMATISFLYPAQSRGVALGLAAGLGNLGVGLTQLVVPIVIVTGVFGGIAGLPQVWNDGAATGDVWLQNAGYVWVPAILAIAILAWFGMDNLETVRASLADQAVVFVRRDTWVLAWLYLGTFGSFVGFAAGFPLVAETHYASIASPWHAFVGPLLGALARPIGGWLADRHGGAKVAIATFVTMGAAVSVLLLLALTRGASPAYPLFLALFAVLFLASGIGNGAVFQMIPAVFVANRRRACADAQDGGERALREGTLEGAAALGLASGIAAFGGFFIPKAYGTAMALTGSTTAALYPFLVFYASCIALTWWFYGRSDA